MFETTSNFFNKNNTMELDMVTTKKIRNFSWLNPDNYCVKHEFSFSVVSTAPDYKKSQLFSYKNIVEH